MSDRNELEKEKCAFVWFSTFLFNFLQTTNVTIYHSFPIMRVLSINNECAHIFNPNKFKRKKKPLKK